jgi:hypothetical protein
MIDTAKWETGFTTPRRYEWRKQHHPPLAVSCSWELTAAVDPPAALVPAINNRATSANFSNSNTSIRSSVIYGTLPLFVFIAITCMHRNKREIGSFLCTKSRQIINFGNLEIAKFTRDFSREHQNSRWQRPCRKFLGFFFGIFLCDITQI